MKQDKVELMELYGIKTIGGGAYSEGFLDCLGFMDKECKRLRKIIYEKDKIIFGYMKTRGDDND